MATCDYAYPSYDNLNWYVPRYTIDYGTCGSTTATTGTIYYTCSADSTMTVGTTYTDPYAYAGLALGPTPCVTGTVTTTVWPQWTANYDYSYPALPDARGDRIDFNRPAAETNRNAPQVPAYSPSAAEAKAEELMMAMLDEEQKTEYKKDQHFTVLSMDGKRKYRIRKGYSRNIDEIDEQGKRVRTLCAHIQTRYNTPVFDHMLSQKLSLELNEQHFLRLANVS